MNGQKRIDAFRPPGGTRYQDEDSYLKTGIYRDTAIDQSAVLYLIDARVARSYDSAAALVGPAGLTGPAGGQPVSAGPAAARAGAARR